MDETVDRPLPCPVPVSFEALHRSRVCAVCGSAPAWKNFDVITCASCKMFFRRNGNRDLSATRCRSNQPCDVRQNNRRRCVHCRLLKCFAVGMNRELFRSSHRNNNAVHHPNKEFIYPLDLLQADRSSLTTDQWILLSNVVRTYESQCSVDDVRKFLIDQSSSPVKLRMKFIAANCMKSVTSIFTQVIRFIERISHFQNLPIKDRTILIERHTPSLGGLNGLLVARELNLLCFSEYASCTAMIYGETTIQKIPDIVNRLDRNDTLVRLLIVILSFSSCYSTDDDFRDILQRSIAIFDIQNLYVEVMFKYMLFRYDHAEASIRFSRLIKVVLDQNLRLEAVRSIEPHRRMISTVTKRSFLLDDPC